MRPMAHLVFFLLAACSSYKVGAYNTPPTATISAPPEGTSYNEGVLIRFEGRVQDDFDDPPSLGIQWNSDIDGILREGEHADGEGKVVLETASLTVGNHIISLYVTDSSNEMGKATVGITIVDLPDAPTLEILSPVEGESGSEGDESHFEARVSDLQDAAPDLIVTFNSDIDGDFCEPVPDSAGIAECDGTLSVGRHLLTYTVEDSDGFKTSANRYFTVISRTEIDDDGDGFTESQNDCDDTDASVHPSATEYWNDRDDDCDGVTDEATEGYDDDGDGFSEAEGDCDDLDPETWPGAPETYDAEDDDCDGTVDEGTIGYDDDSDGWTEVAGDCDDSYSATWPGATELADGEDNDCDGIIDEGTSLYDDDGDGYSEAAGDCDDTNSDIRPGATESCDSRDNDCDGTIDEEGASGCSYFYADNDKDGYGAGAGKCLCAATASYSSVLNTDCYDGNANAYPGASTYYTRPRGDSSYDYNCDGTESKYYTATYSCATEWYCFACSTYTEGWAGSVPSCGSNGTWYTGCTASWCSCSHTGSMTLTQACR